MARAATGLVSGRSLDVFRSVKMEMKRATKTGLSSRSWAAQPEVWGDNATHFWDQRGTGGGPMKMIFASMFINATTRQQISIYSIDPF